jgi:hypothetical protein
MNLRHLREQYHREHEWTFTHENKWMAVQCTPRYNPVRLIIDFVFNRLNS